ncbi:hypothetical protein [Parabacteroides sp. FAFU027]|uniref:hypothetical protein n=1 Tax=Parabacteroides sp. FAFU027 TaxID=2922715 RepID=UPI001FAECDA2|nr:hypothetical protein [Parabacteroides sp. FAFU027]
MFYILWVILNIGLLLDFLYLLYKAIVVVKREMGLLPVIFLIVIIAGQCSHSREHDKNNSQTNSGNNQCIYSHKIKLSPINGLIVDCATDSTGQVDYKRSALTGTLVGVEWESVAEHFNNRHYTVVGVLKWNLWGINIWSQFKTFEGDFTRKDLIWDHTTHSASSSSKEVSVIKRL